MNYMVSPRLDLTVADRAPSADEVTFYDEQHAVTYLRLLDADVLGAVWQEVAQVVLHRDPVAEPEQSRRCWESHLARAHWMMTRGYRALLNYVAGQSDPSIPTLH